MSLPQRSRSSCLRPGTTDAPCDVPAPDPLRAGGVPVSPSARVRRRWRGLSFLIALVACVVFIGWLWRWLQIDQCLDAGGAWQSHDPVGCEYDTTAAPDR